MGPKDLKFSRPQEDFSRMCNVQQKGSRFEVGGLRIGSGREIRAERSQVFAVCSQASKSVRGRKSSRNAKLSSLLDLRCVFASQKCQLSQGSGGSWSRNAELSSLLDSCLVLASQKCQLSQGSEGTGGKICRTVVTFGLAFGPRVSKVSTLTGIGGIGGSWSRNAKLSSLLDLRLVFASQKCQRSQGWEGSWSRNAKLSSLLNLVAKRRREERGEREEEREEHREERGEERRERGEERRERGVERSEERRERREERREKRIEKREERRERRAGRRDER